MLLVCGPAAGKQPNILFIFADDHARRAISVYGSDLAEIAPTPNIDRLAGAGAQLRHSFCANSLCGPV
jgi:N-acetylglucosamine-6-sulfatase